MPTTKEDVENQIKMLNERIAQLNRDQTIEIATLQQNLLALIQQLRTFGEDTPNQVQVEIVNPVTSQPLIVTAKTTPPPTFFEWTDSIKITPENIDKFSNARDSSGNTIQLSDIFKDHPEQLQELCNLINKIFEKKDDDAAKKCGLNIVREDKGDVVRSTYMDGDKKATIQQIESFLKCRADMDNKDVSDKKQPSTSLDNPMDSGDPSGEPRLR